MVRNGAHFNFRYSLSAWRFVADLNPNNLQAFL
jgi:hypothetical protein